MLMVIMDILVLAIYLIQVSRKLYVERGVDCYVDFLDEVSSACQIKKDACALYGSCMQDWCRT
jgi:hypothetical protein